VDTNARSSCYLEGHSSDSQDNSNKRRKLVVGGTSCGAFESEQGERGYLVADIYSHNWDLFVLLENQ
jgi:hypothetical protein